MINEAGARFDVSASVDVHDTHAQLQLAGLEPTRPQRHPWGKTDFKIIDPDGNTFEFSPYEGHAGAA